MADASEDAMQHPPSLDPDARPTAAQNASTSDAEDDEDEQAQDYTPLARSTLPYDPTAPDRLLTSIALDAPLPAHALSHAPAQPHTSTLLPRRGEKDFEPHPTDAQAARLSASRTAMAAALSHARVHAPRARVLGVYDAAAVRVRVRRRRGVWLAAVGRDLPGGAVELLPEEALWALEGGRLDVRYGDAGAAGQDGEEGDVDAEEERLLPMSLQGAYAAFLGQAEGTRGQGLTMQKYVVFAGLKRAGFVVTRAEGFFGLKTVRCQNASAESQEQERHAPREQEQPLSLLAWFARLFTSKAAEEAERERQRWGPLVKPGIYRNYQDIFRLLQVIPAPSPVDPAPGGDTTIPIDDGEVTTTTIETPYTTTYNIYQPNTHFKKRAPPAPAFRVCVVPARETRFPTPAQLDGLLEEQLPDESATDKAGVAKANPTREPAEAKRTRTLGATYGAIKRGRCSVLIAIVEEGVVSYMRISEGGFVDEGRLFEREGGGNERKKGGGRGGRGGRGRGRGRGRA